MRKQMIENAAYELAAQVRTAEESIEAAIAELAELQMRMVRARSVTGAAFVASHAPFEHVAAATTGLVAARGGIANCHSVLATMRETIPGLRTVAWGDTEDCPPAASAVQVPDLRVVA
jgi:Tfp pilus assembly protein FimV